MGDASVCMCVRVCAHIFMCLCGWVGVKKSVYVIYVKDSMLLFSNL